MGVSKNRGTPKWMVYNGKPYEQMDDLGGFTPLFLVQHPYLRKNLQGLSGCKGSPASIITLGNPLICFPSSMHLGD